jgi:hypothetical protein
MILKEEQANFSERRTFYFNEFCIFTAQQTHVILVIQTYGILFRNISETQIDFLLFFSGFEHLFSLVLIGPSWLIGVKQPKSR